MVTMMLAMSLVATWATVVLVVAWVLLAFWPARFAGRKGHSFFGYFILSLVFFPLALVTATSRGTVAAWRG